MHSDVTKVVQELIYYTHTVKIVERWRMGKAFLYFYVFDADGKEVGGTDYFHFKDVKDLSDLSVAIPQIKSCIKKMVEQKMHWWREREKKKEAMNWTGRMFNRHDYVHFKGNDKYKPCDTYVWTHFAHLSLDYYIIQHHDGNLRDRWLNKKNDGFESIHSKYLDEGLKYIQVDCSKDFQFETDALVLIMSAKDIELDKVAKMKVE